MPIPLASVSVTAGQTYTVYVGSPHTVGAVVIANESPYAINASPGSGGQWIVAQTADLVPCDTSAFSGTLTITTDNYLSNASNAPSFQLYLTAYAPGEPIRGTYPAPLVRLTTGTAVTSNNPATTLEQDLLTPFVLSGLVPSKDGTVPNQLDVTAGIALLRQSDSSLLRQSLVAASFLTSAATSTYFLDLNPDASWSWGTSHSAQSNYMTIAQATTDASGNISGVTDERPLTTTLLSGFSGTVDAPYNFSIPQYLYFTNAGAPAGALGEATFSSPFLFLYANGGGTSSAIIQGVYNGSTLAFPFAVGSPGSEPVLSYVDGAGVLHSVAPVTLKSGYQETGYVSAEFTATGASQIIGVPVNFKSTLANTPSNITLSMTTSGNVSGSPQVLTISQYGFTFVITSAAAGSCYWRGSYTTVGN